jgi:hypothetical protein
MVGLFIFVFQQFRNTSKNNSSSNSKYYCKWNYNDHNIESVIFIDRNGICFAKALFWRYAVQHLGNTDIHFPIICKPIFIPHLTGRQNANLHSATQHTQSKLPSMPIANFKHVIPSTFFHFGCGMAPRLYGNAVIVHPGQQISENSYGGLVD